MLLHVFIIISFVCIVVKKLIHLWIVKLLLDGWKRRTLIFKLLLLLLLGLNTKPCPKCKIQIEKNNEIYKSFVSPSTFNLIQIQSIFSTILRQLHYALCPYIIHGYTWRQGQKGKVITKKLIQNTPAYENL